MRTKINILLGALIALLSGCKSQQPVIQPNERIRVLYGPPSVFYEQIKDSTENKDQPTPPNTFQQNKVERPDNSKSL
jgi:hypothetical protein